MSKIAADVNVWAIRYLLENWWCGSWSQKSIFFIYESIFIGKIVPFRPVLEMMYRWMCYFAGRRRRNFEFLSKSNIFSLRRRLLRFCYHLAILISVSSILCIDSNQNQNSFPNGWYRQRDESHLVKSTASFGINLLLVIRSTFSLVSFWVKIL